MIYGTLLSVMLMIVSIYVVLALQLLVPDQTTTTAVAPSSTPSPMAVPATPTSAPAAPTLAPSSTLEPSTATPEPPLPTAAAVTEIAPGVTMEFVEVPAGPFLMGSSDDDRDAQDDEKPQHEITLPTYYIGKTEVTNAQFRPFVEGDGYTNPDYWGDDGWAWREANDHTHPGYWDDEEWNGDEQPVVGISWYEAMAYARWLSAQTGDDYRLPTEAEWEKAARGADGVIYPWGNEWQEGLANSKEAGEGGTVAVGSYPAGASPYGALDMAGNVWEWCVTKWVEDYPYQLEDEWTTEYLASKDLRTVRGGSWFFEQRFARWLYRDDLIPRYRNLDLGLRLASSSLPSLDVET
jgi:formylglycine-generating enzyme required for sulfatase activity